MKKTLCIVSALLALAACDQPNGASPEAAKPSAVASAAAPAKTTDKPAPKTAAAADADSDDVPTEEDFEDQAETEITAANLEAEIGKLEKEVSP